MYYFLNIVIQHKVAILFVNGKCIAITCNSIKVNTYLLKLLPIARRLNYHFCHKTKTKRFLHSYYTLYFY